jgi:D-beta-D-heptose 7-phosphate kinase/D-beta-D-heptose 1-phosphate adenosyltransferase
MSLLTNTMSEIRIPAVARSVFDVTGAGDTVIGILALALSAGATLEQAARLANFAAGIVVGKVGTATVTREELIACIEQP